MKQKLKKLWVWLRKEILVKDMIAYVIIAELIFWSPAIVFGLLAIFVRRGYWALFSAVIAFWSGPFTPAVPLQLGLAFGLKKVFGKVKKRRKPRQCVKMLERPNW